jgi:hypothetical protein
LVFLRALVEQREQSVKIDADQRGSEEWASLPSASDLLATIHQYAEQADVRECD